MALFGKGKDKDDDKLSAEERAARREERRANRKKKKDGDSDEPESRKSDKQVGANRSRKDESVIRETVFETAVSIMKANKLFRVSRDDEDLFVGILLKFDDIGGLSKKDMKDESKGQIITLINSGGIASIFTADLKSKDQIVFIPNKATLEQMSEFSLLADDLEYELVLVNAYDETIEGTDVFVSLDYLMKCHKSNMGIASKLTQVLEPTLLPGDEGYNSGSAEPRGFEPEPEPEPMAAAASTFDESDGLIGGDDPEDYGSDGDYSDDGDGYSGDDGDGEFEDFEGGEFEDGEPSGESDDGEGGYDPEDGQESGPSVYVGAESSAMALSRKFFNDDMARELDTSALEQAIAGIGQFRPLLMRPEDTWLNQQLNVMIDLANRELFALHQQNLDVVRNAYLNAIGSAYIDEMSQVQDYKSDERYAQIAAQVEEASAGVDDMVVKERERLKAEWDEKVRNAGEVARMNAEQQYRERYQYQYEERLRNIDAEVRAGLQAAENRAIAELKSARQREAQIRLDHLDSEQIAIAVDAYREMLASEAELYTKHESEIMQFLENSREEEIARIRVLDSELSRDEKVTQIQNEYKAKAEALQADFETRIAALQSDIDTTHIRHNRDLADKDAAYAALQAKYDADKSEWKAQVSDLTAEVVKANESKEREVKIRVDEMRAERDSYSQKYDHLVKTQKSTSMLMLALGVAAVLAALMVGIVIGGRLYNPGSGNEPVQDDSPAVSDTVLDDNAQDGNSDAQEDPGTGTPQEPSGGEQQEPASDPAWEAMQDPVI